MGFAFEVKETDLMGRIGSIKVRGKALETPCLLPVVHPVSQAVSPQELRSMGFDGIMTNSYILSSRRRDEALKKGVHELVGFDGVVATDSGGYQVLEYGSLGLGHAEVARFQAEIGSDLAVTLDRPTGYPQDRKTAGETMRYSLRNALLTMSEFEERETSWIGPIQGGLYLDLVKKSASSLVKGGFEVLALGSPVQVMQNYMFADLARMILAAKGAIPYSAPLHLFGAGHTLTTPLAVALGCDTFDSASYILFARQGRYMGRSGVADLRGMKYLPCLCAVCSKTSVDELLSLDYSERTRKLAVHNLFAIKQEVDACKEAIVEGRLWDLVEERSFSHPRLREAFKTIAANSKLLREGTPASKDRGVFLRSYEDRLRPEFLTAEARLAGARRRGSSKAVLRSSQGGRKTSRGKSLARGPKERYDLYRVHPVLGAYPEELEFAYPLGQTVLSDDVNDSAMVRHAISSLKKMGYGKVELAARRRRRVMNRRNPRGASPSPRGTSALLR